MRKIEQFCIATESEFECERIIALFNDGSLWFAYIGGSLKEWTRLPVADIPQDGYVDLESLKLPDMEHRRCPGCDIDFPVNQLTRGLCRVCYSAGRKPE